MWDSFWSCSTVLECSIFFIHPPTLYFGWGSFQGVVFKIADFFFFIMSSLLGSSRGTGWGFHWVVTKIVTLLVLPVFWGALGGSEPSEWSCFPWLVFNSLLGFPSFLFPCWSDADGELLLWYQLQLFSILCLIVTQPVAYLKLALLTALPLCVCFSHGFFQPCNCVIAVHPTGPTGYQNWGEQARDLCRCVVSVGPEHLKCLTLRKDKGSWPCLQIKWEDKEVLGEFLGGWSRAQIHPCLLPQLHSLIGFQRHMLMSENDERTA